MQAHSSPPEPPGKPKNTGVGSLTLLQRNFQNQESNQGLLHCRWILYQLEANTHTHTHIHTHTHTHIYIYIYIHTHLCIYSVEFSHSVMSYYLRPHCRTAARQASLSITNSWSLVKLISIELVMPSNHLILCHPLLLPSIYPSIRVFSKKSVLHIRWPKYWSFGISPSNEYS